MPYCILRTAKLKKIGNIAASLSHTFRDRRTENADPARKAQNEPSDERTAKDVLADIEARLPTKCRRDAVLCIEYFIGASPEWFGRPADEDAYFGEARRWLITRHGAENVTFSAIHRDERTPHLVAYVVPIHEGKLNAKHWLGGKAKLSAMQTDFARTVGQPFGLRRGIEGSKAKHTTVQQFYAAISGPVPSAPRPEISTPPLLGREEWAKSESARIAASLRPVIQDAAKAARWGRFQASARRQAQETAQQQSDKAMAARGEAHRLQRDNQRLMEQLREWADTYEDGLTDDQVDQLAALARQMRDENRMAVEQALGAREEYSANSERLAPGV